MTPVDTCKCGHWFGVHQKATGPERLMVRDLKGEPFFIPARCCPCRIKVRMPEVHS